MGPETFVILVALIVCLLLYLYASLRVGEITERKDDDTGERLAMSMRETDWRWPR